MKRGFPPTALKALTGLFTPPGITFDAFLNKSFDFRQFILTVLYLQVFIAGETAASNNRATKHEITTTYKSFMIKQRVFQCQKTSFSRRVNPVRRKI
jgi:hypothetical protein